MALNFPDSPTLNQVYTDSTSGFSYQWDGTVWQSYSEAATDNISIVDDISSLFDGVTDTFALAVSGSSISPGTAQQMRVVLGGIVQEPLTDYTVSGSNIVFSTPPSGGLDCSIVSLGRAIPLSVAVIADGSVTPAKLSTGGPSWNTGGGVYISGITTIADVVKVGVGTTSLIVEGDARITGILTIGTSSVTIDGVNNQISIGTLNITESGISGGTPNITVGVITASSAVIGSAVTITSGGVLTVGIVTAADFNSTSDINLKENITTVDNALDIANQLRGVRFEWKKDHRPSYGVIAQELEQILPELVTDTDPKTVNYNGIIGVLIEAIKELKNEIEELKNDK